MIAVFDGTGQKRHLPISLIFIGEFIMASPNVKKSVEFDAAERAWIKIAIQNQIKMLMRARTKEVVGGEVHALRGKEIQQLQAIAEMVS